MKNLIVLFGVLAVMAVTANADVAFSDDFTDNNYTSPAWYRTNYGSYLTIGVVNDPNVGGIGLDSGLALEYVDSATATSSTMRYIVANTETVILSAMDDYITLSFDMRYVNNPVVAANLRFGFFDSKGTKVTSDQSGDPTAGNANSVRDDVGYCARLAVGASTTMQIYGETANGGLMGGTEQSYGSSVALTTPFNNNNKHHIVFQYKLIDSGGVLRPQFYLTIDGQTLDRNSLTLSPSLTFNEIALTSSQSGNDLRIDNVQVTSNKVYFNQFPVVNAGPDKVLASTGETLTMAATATDPEAQPLTLKWTKLTGPGTVTFTPSDTVEDPVVSFSAGGTYTLELAATDDGPLTTRDTLTVVVQDPANNALLAHWDFETLTPDEPNVYDVTVNNYDGAWILSDPNADPNYVDGWITGASPDLAAKFYAGKSIGIVPPAGSALNTGLQGGLTVACWVRVDNAAAFQASDRIIDKGDWGLIAAPSGSGSVKFRLSNQADVGVNAVTPVTDGNWHHVAGVYDGFNMKMYIDGIEEGTGATTGVLPVTTVRLTMGADASNAYKLEQVAVDDVRIYNYGLDAAGVAALAAMGDNLPPHITSLTVSKTAIILPEDTIALSATAIDPDLDTMTYAWTKVSGAGTVTFSAPSALSTNATFSAKGRYTLRLSVSDGTAVVPANTSLITVYPVGWNGETAYMPYNTDPNESLWGDAPTAVVGAPTYIAGKIGNAIKFSGTGGDHLEYAPSMAKADGDFTFMAWVRRDVTGTDEMDIAGQFFNNTPEDGFRLTFRGNAPNQFRMYIGDSINGTYQAFYGGTYIVGQWQHFAFTYKYNGGTVDNEIKTYLDGVLTGTVITPREIGPNTTVPFTIGMRARNASNYLNGAVDELYLYNRVLTQSEIASKAGLNIPPVVDAGQHKKIIQPATSIALNGSASDTDPFTVLWSKVEGPGSVSFAPDNNAATTVTITQVGDYILRLTGTDSFSATAYDDVCVKVRPAGFNGLEAHIQFENADPNLALISTVGLGYAGTAYGDPNVGTVEVGSAKSKLGSGALDLFGGDEYVTYNKFLGSDPSLTVSVWFNCRDLATGGRVINKWANSGSGLGWMIRVRNGDGNLAAMIGSAFNGPGDYVTGPIGLFGANEWVHAVLTYDAGVMRLYQNGALIREQTGVAYSPADFVTPMAIGRRLDNTSEMFNGLIDEVRIYDYALSVAQVKALYAGDGGLPWNTCLTPNLVPDFDNDCQVGVSDIQYMASVWLTGDVTADIAPTVADGQVDLQDFSLLADQWLDCDDLDLGKCL